MKDSILPTYEELKTIFKQEWSKLEEEEKQTELYFLMLGEITMMMEFKSTSSILSKCKPRTSH